MLRECIAAIITASSASAGLQVERDWPGVFFARKNIDWIDWSFHMKITLLSTSATVCGLVVLAMACVFTRRSTWSRKAINKIGSLHLKIRSRTSTYPPK